MVIRDAALGDAEAMSRVLIASITELCAADHHGQPSNIDSWTANKSPESTRGWLANPASRVVVADADRDIVGVAAVSDAGEVLLNYVAPWARFTGISKALLAHVENLMRQRGIDEAHLTSTATAHRFYVANGWRDCGEPEERFGIRCNRMSKKLG